VSGFAGVVTLDGAPPDTHLLERTARTLAFRGPDGTHIISKPGAGFCFTFLRTGPAPQCPSQPCSLDGRIWLLGDVRLDGRNDLRRKLEQHGDAFDGDPTDEELILRAWRRWREDSLPDLIGDYSFALWDAEARQLWCARDLMGARPFFYAQGGDQLYFSNTLSAIRCAPDISNALDDHFIGDFLLEGWNSEGSRTAFRDVSRLPSGHVLRYSSTGLDVRRFTSVPIEVPLQLKSVEEYIEQFGTLLEQAIAERLPPGNAAIFMSGGLDSTSVAGLAVRSARSRNLPLSLRAYNVHYESLFDDEEQRYAAIAARHIGIPIDVQVADFCLPYAGWDDDSLPLAPEPFHEPFRLLYIEQNRRIAEQAHVAFNGYGGDGVLTGQAWPYLVDLFRSLRLATAIRVFCGYFLANGRFPPLRGGFRSRWRRWSRRIDPMDGYPQWLAPEFEKQVCLRQRWRDLRQPPQDFHPWYPTAFTALNTSYWPSLLECEDAARTAAPVEARSPLLDVRVQRFLLRVPPVSLCIDKELLRVAGRGLLPQEILARPKTPLVGDPLVLQIEKRLWNPPPLAASGTAIDMFVNCDKLGEITGNSDLFSPWRDLLPLSLQYWLKSIESKELIG
jgi:asparagine synthase (glutamine-hydrolysing)